MDGPAEYRFMSFNIPNLHMIEDQMPFDEIQAWRLPDTYELRDAFASIQQLGGQVVRTYVITVQRPDDLPQTPKHVLGPGVFNEAAFRSLDTLMALASEYGVRVILPFVDNWPWMGGRAEYAGFRGLNKDAFWSDPLLIADFKLTIDYLINRVNTVTGLPYREDKALLAWETGNELSSTPEWVAEIAAYIKQLDSNHLVIDGYHSNLLRDSSLDDPNIDLVTTHHYERDPSVMVQHIMDNQNRAQGRKPYFIGEFGFISTSGLEAAMNTIIASGAAGGLTWSLRFHSRDGGFYWHSEGLGLGLYKAFHWPGFASGADYDETQVFKLIRQKAFEIRGLPAPPLQAPQTPRLLPIESPVAISWQGSAGAAAYDLERSTSLQGPWRTLGAKLSDAEDAYRPLFADATTKLQKTYFYRVRARNNAGRSGWSNIQGPVSGIGQFLVDPMQRTAQIFTSGGNLQFTTANARQAKEDLQRLMGESGSFISYYLESGFSKVQIDCFFPGDVLPPLVSVSLDGRIYESLALGSEDFFLPDAAYGYWKPVRYSLKDLEIRPRYVKIEWQTKMQIGHTIIGP